MTGRISAVAIALTVAGAIVPASAGDFDDIVGQYLRRSDSVTPGAGNAAAANTVIHMIDPWPPYAGNRRIPGNGQRMSGAVERYRDIQKLSASPPPISHPAASAAASSAGAATPAPNTGISSTTK